MAINEYKLKIGELEHYETHQEVMKRQMAHDEDQLEEELGYRLNPLKKSKCIFSGSIGDLVFASINENKGINKVAKVLEIEDGGERVFVGWESTKFSKAKGEWLPSRNVEPVVDGSCKRTRRAKASP
jgi:hypothetical protein